MKLKYSLFAILRISSIIGQSFVQSPSISKEKFNLDKTGEEEIGYI